MKRIESACMKTSAGMIEKGFQDEEEHGMLAILLFNNLLLLSVKIHALHSIC